MERNREARRGTSAAVNGLSRRRQRNSYRESLDEDGGMEMQEMGGRLRDRGGKKDRARDRSGRTKRRRVDRHANNRDEAENSSEDSNNEDDDDEDASEASIPVRLPPPPLPPPPLNSGSAAVSVSHNHHRKSFPKAGRSSAVAWKPADEMIGVPVPRKARSSSAKRSHEFSASGSGGGEPIHASPARPSPTSSTQLLPSSSSARKKMMPVGGNGGSKHRPEKINKSPSVSEDLEIEVAEVLFGLTRQFQSPAKPETHKLDSKATNGSSNEANGSSNEANSRVSSPISISPQPAEPQPQPPVLAPSNPSSLAAPAAAPKRKRPRLPRLEGDSLAVPSTSASSSAAKMDSSQSAKVEASSSRLEKIANLTGENGTGENDQGVPQVGIVAVDVPQDSTKPQNNLAPELKISLGGSVGQDRDEVKQKAASPSMKECPPLSLSVNADKSFVAKAAPVDENPRKTPKFSFDLMVPPLVKSSSDREGMSDYSSTGNQAKDTAIRKAPKGEIDIAEEVKNVKSSAIEAEEVKLEVRTANSNATTEVDLKEEERNMDLQLDFDKPVIDNVACYKQHVRKQPKGARMEHGPDKAEQSAPSPMTVAGWPGKPGSFPSFGYMAQVPPLQGVAPGDGTTACSKPIQRPNYLSSENRPKRCATHGYIAHNIYYHQQVSRMNPGRPAAAGAPPLYAPKHPDTSAANHYNLNAAPPSESLIPGNSLQGNLATNLVPIPEKAGQLAATYPSHSIKEKSSAGNAFAEAALRKQLVLQQAPPGSVGNMLHGPAFIFSMNQPQAAAAAAAHFGSSKPIPGTGNAATSSNAASSMMGSSGVSGPGMTFNYPVMPTNEAHYMSLLQNSGYPFPFPAHSGAPAIYKGGGTVQPVPFFNGSFYSSQMLPPQFQQHQQQQASAQQPSSSHAKTGHQSTSASSGSSSSQKAPPQSKRAPGGGPIVIPGSTQGLSAPKQQRQQLAPQCETGTESPSTADSRALQAQKNIYGPNLAMAMHPQNYAFITPAGAVAAAALGSGSGTHSEKQQASSQHQSMKAELATSQAFTFASAAAAPPGMDFSSMAQNHALFQSLPEAAKHGYHISAAASPQASQHRKQHNQIAEDGKSTGTNASTGEEERKTITWAKSLGNVPSHPVNFSRSDNDPQNPAINSSSRTLNLIQAPPANGVRLSNRPASAAPAATCNAPTAPSPPISQQQQQQQHMIQLQKQQHHQQQQILQMQQQFANRSAKSSTPNNSAAMYSDQLPAGSTMSKFPQALAGFPQSFLQSSGTPQSPQWKASNRASTPGPPSPAASSSKSQPAQLQGRSMQQSPLMPGHQTQISFGAGSSLKAAVAAGQQHLYGASSNPPLSSVAAMASGSPQSPAGKPSGGSPRPSSSSKPGTAHSHAAASPLQQQQQQSGKNSPSSRSSPLSSSNTPSILGHPPITTAMNASNKQQQTQSQQQQQQTQSQQQQQQQMPKQQFPQALFFSNAYLQAQTSQSNGPPAGMYYHQRRPSEQQSQQSRQNSPSGGSTTGDPVKAAAAAAATATSSNMKAMAAAAGMLQHSTQFGAPAHPSMPFMSVASGFPYIHGMPSASASTKASEQKPPGNDNPHASWQQPEKK